MENIEVALIGVITLFIGLMQALRTSYSKNVEDTKLYGEGILDCERRILKYRSYITKLQLKLLDYKEENVKLKKELIELRLDIKKRAEYNSIIIKDIEGNTHGD